MPTAVRYIQQVEKEQRHLPHLQAHLPYDVPQPIAVGEPGMAILFRGRSRALSQETRLHP